MIELKIGERFDLFVGRNLRGQNGCVFEQMQGGGVALIVYLDNMTIQEQLVLKHAKISVRVIREDKDLLLTMIRYDGSPLIFEMSFDPTLYKNKPEQYNQFIKSNMLTIIGIDSNTNIIKTLRLVSVPKRLYSLWISVWMNALKNENFSQKYNKWIDDLDSRYSVIKLWNMAENYGKMGQIE